ncbi:hypothetical protein ACHHYP_05779 [Achlya hypogyna]|uniref:TRP C-terminal domain-containing protein n=1 Tax=Achlya hypogyna TaxID=1202772 RepID=A0A1V9YWG6_ACHHY|nr:hypothetical protein ACHHYP_05779 [Achlya hypogyna]
MHPLRVLAAGLAAMAATADAQATCRFALNVSPGVLKLIGTANGTVLNNSTMVVPSPAGGNSTTLPPHATTLAPKATTKAPAPDVTTSTPVRMLAVENTTTSAPTTLPLTPVPDTTKKTTEPPVTTDPKDPTSKTPAPTTTPPAGSGSGTPGATTLPGGVTKTPTPTPSNTTNTINLPTPAVATTFDIIPCDATFYGFWKTKGLKCGGLDLDVTKAAAASCTVYHGALTVGTKGFPACFSSCFIPGCSDGAWDYSATDGISSSVYAGVNFLEAATAAKAATSATASLFSTLSTAFKSDYSCSTYDICQCPAANIGTGSGNSTGSAAGSQKRSDTWADGTKKTNLDYAGVVTSSVSTTITYTAIATTTTMMIASSVGAVGSSASAAAAGISTGGSVGMASATLDIAQFSVCISQLSLPGASQPLRAIGQQMSFSVFTWFSFGNTQTSATSRRLVEEYVGTRDASTSGMFQYTSRLGIRSEMLFYVTIAGIASVIGGIVILLALVLVLGPMCVKDKQAFMANCYDRAVGLIMLVTIISQYALGVVCMFQITLCVMNKKGHVFSKELVFAVLTLLVLALGIMGYGVYVVKKYQREIQDMGTAQHLEKPVHKRFGCLYDEYDYANRYFFTAKMGLALLSGMVAGSFAVNGQAQLVMLIILHVGFFLLLSVRRPHHAPFVQNTTVIITVVKVITFGLSFLLLNVAVQGSGNENITNVISMVILALQLAVLVCLLARQVYIFYKTHQLKKELAAQNDTMRHEDAYALDALTQPGAYAMATNSTHARETNGYGKQREWTSESHRVSDDKARLQKQPSKLKSLQGTGPNQHNGQWKEDEYDPREYAI